MKAITKIAMSIAAVPMACLPAAADDNASGIKVEHLGTNNTMVRVDTDSQFLMLPVQEAYDDATVNVVVDGKLDRTIFVRLAKSKVDYSVPFDLTPYKGHDVVLNIITTHDRSTVREAKDDACWNNFRLTDSIDVTNTEKFRPAYHHTPEYGWMNDPNGMFYKDGKWHLYYQWNPYGSKWQNMTWGHSTSDDLINWEHHPAAILPNGLGSVFSGSSAVDVDNSAGLGKDAVVAMYTSAGASQTQSLAYSHDNGETFTIYPGNPVITLDSEARDPNMFWNPETQLWTLVLAHALDREMLIFTSPDMKEWTLRSSFGKGLGAQGGVWECPDLLELTVEGTDKKKWLLICNINPGGPFGGSGIQYFTGDFDGKTFTVDTDADGSVPTKWLDYGKDNYALVTWSNAPDGRRPAIGWMSNWQYAAEVPTRQFRSANTLPIDLSLFEGNDGRIYAAMIPAAELTALRGKTTVNQKSVSIGKGGKSFMLPADNDGVCELEMNIDPGSAASVSLTFSNDKGEKVVMIYDPKADTLSFDRRESGIVDFSEDFPAVTTAPTHTEGGMLALRIFIDRSSFEVFANGGKGVMTNLVFPNEPYSKLTVATTSGSAKIKNLKIYSINTTL